MKPEVKRVFAQLNRPTERNPLGAVVEGAYVFADGVVTLTDRNGKPVKDEDGKNYKMPVGDNPPDIIAMHLTRKFRNARRAKKGAVAGFSGPLNYPKLGWL